MQENTGLIVYKRWKSILNSALPLTLVVIVGCLIGFVFSQKQIETEKQIEKMKIAMKEFSMNIETEKEGKIKKEFEEKKQIFIAEKETTRKDSKLTAVTYTSRGTKVDRTVNYDANNLINIDNKEENTEKPTEYKEVIDVKATAYCLCKKCCGKSPDNPGYGITSSGLKIVPGTNMKVIAVDKKIIPLGTKVYVEGLDGNPDYGYAIAADTGGAIKNYKIDLYMDSHTDTCKWGIRNMRVYILD